MKKFLLLAMVVSTSYFANAQETIDTAAPAPKPVKVRKSNGNSSKAVATSSATPAEKHPADHLLIEIGGDSWLNKPSSIDVKGGRHFNFYLMMDKPFKTNPHFSVAYGAGLGTNNIYFGSTQMNIDSSQLVFANVAGTTHFRKYKFTEIFLEAPVELRYTFDNAHPNKSWKLAIGAKVGLLLKAYTKGKDLQDGTGKSLIGANYIEKQYNKSFFNSTRLSFTGRVGYGNFSLHASYALTPVIKTGFGPEVNNLSIGLCISGL